MKYIQFTYVDALTGVSVAQAPAQNGPVFPPVAGLVFVWVRESHYPTDVPHFFGTCPDDSDTQTDGVMGIFSQCDFEAMRADEMRARDKTPKVVTRRQARQALLLAGLLDDVQAALDAIPDPLERRMAQIEWDDAQEFERHRPLVLTLAAAMGLDEQALDALFVTAAAL